MINAKKYLGALLLKNMLPKLDFLKQVSISMMCNSE